ncbi:MAG: hypothetical protein PHQ23_00115 [Candidatus Wallbacteria bacterium]|nr:hypothetical protein [Candidatus Wallbacteria bacterium]
MKIKFHNEFAVNTDGHIVITGFLDYSGEIKSFDVFAEAIREPGKSAAPDPNSACSFFPLNQGDPERVFFVLLQEKNPVQDPSDSLGTAFTIGFSIEAGGDKLECKIILTAKGVEIVSGEGIVSDLSAEFPQAVTDEELERRIKMAAETYLSDEGFASEFRERAETLAIEEEQAMEIYMEGEVLSGEVAEDSLYLDEDHFLSYLQKEIREVREIVTAMLEQAAG